MLIDHPVTQASTNAPSTPGAQALQPAPQAAPKHASFFQVVGAVLSAFIGIRKQQAADRDVSIRPVHVVIAGIVGGLLFIGLLVAVVRLVVR